MSATIASDVALGIAQLEEAFPGRVAHEPDQCGGAYVTVEGVDLGERWSPARAPLSFHLAYNYPAAAPYPFYLPGESAPLEGWPQVLQRVEWRSRAVVQVSLRHTNWDPTRDSAVGSVLQVQARLRKL